MAKLQTRAAFAGLGLWLLVGSGLAGEAAPPEPEDSREPGRAAPAEAAPPATSEAGPGLPFGAKTIEKLREEADRMPPLSGRERIERAAGMIRPLPVPFAIGATAVGFALMLFGRRLFRFGIVLYFMAMLGMVGREVGQQYAEATGALVGGIAGCVIGAGVALPLRAMLRALVGGLTGGILAGLIVQCVTASPVVTLVAVGLGILASGVLTSFFPSSFLTVGFSLFGAVMASVGVLSVATEPTPKGFLAYGPAHVGGVVLAAALGVLFQSHLEEKGGDD